MGAQIEKEKEKAKLKATKEANMIVSNCIKKVRTGRRFMYVAYGSVWGLLGNIFLVFSLVACDSYLVRTTDDGWVRRTPW